MPSYRDSSSTGRQSRGPARTDTLHLSARPRAADGVIVLYPEESKQPPRPAPKVPMSLDAVLAPLLAERDAALEEVAYLSEQLRSVTAYHAHLLDEERRRMFDERTQLAAELASLREELQRRTYPGGSASWSADGSMTPASHADVAGTR